MSYFLLFFVFIVSQTARADAEALLVNVSTDALSLKLYVILYLLSPPFNFLYIIGQMVPLFLSTVPTTKAWNSNEEMSSLLSTPTLLKMENPSILSSPKLEPIPTGKPLYKSFCEKNKVRNSESHF
jgi:hypothetical protein